MSKDYTMRNGKEAAIAGNRHRMEEAQHSSSDAFVKSQEAKLSRMAGRAPKLEAKDMEFNAVMMNDGAHAEEFGRMLTKGLDKEAFPVK